MTERFTRQSPAPGPGVDEIAILDPGGAVERRVPFTGERMTLGREPGNDLVLDRPGVSRRHARVELSGGRYTVTDLNSTNGTCLGDVRLLPGVPEVWAPGTLLGVGNCWLRLEPAAATQGAAGGARAVAGGPTAGEAEGPARVAAFSEAPDLAVEAGSSVTVKVTVLNQGPVVDHFQVSIAGVPQSWLPGAPPVVRLLPGARQEVGVTIQPPRSPESRAGAYPLTIQVRSQDAPGEAAEVAATLTVAPFYGADVELHPQHQSTLVRGTFQVQLTSAANADLTLQLKAVDPEEGCDYAFDPPQVTLPAGEALTVPLSVRPRLSLGAVPAKSYQFTVTAQALEAPELRHQVYGQWTQVAPQFELALRPPQQSGAGSATFGLQIKNAGQTDLSLQLEASGQGQASDCALAPAQISVPAGQEASAQLTVKPRSPLTGEATRLHHFTVTARVLQVPGVERQAHGEWEEVAAAAKRASAGCAFWLLWALAGALGGLVGGTIGPLVNVALHAPPPLTAVGWAVVGALIGAAQWAVLRRHVPQVGRWVLASATGWAVGGLVIDILTSMDLRIVSWGVGAVVVGAAQLPVLHGKVRGAGWWVPVSALGWGAAGVLVGGQLIVAGVEGWIAAWTLGGGMSGAITGLPLMGLLRRTVAKQET